MTYNQRQQIIDSVNGNIKAWIADQHTEPLRSPVECVHCDCDMSDGHRCLVCDAEISIAGCEKRDGHCTDCFNELQWDLKN